MRRIWTAYFMMLVAACAAPTGPIATEQEFRRWAAEDSARQEAFVRFEAMLRRQGVADVLPAYDLWIVDRLKTRCMHAPFVAPPEEQWPNIVETLRFIRDYVEPVVGDVRAVSAFRDQAFNECVGGAPASAHRGFFAIDLMPMDRRVTRETLIERLCAVHVREGRRARVGLGIYQARRFHIDTRSYRGWGADYRGGSFPCRQATASLRNPA